MPYCAVRSRCSTCTVRILGVGSMHVCSADRALGSWGILAVLLAAVSNSKMSGLAHVWTAHKLSCEGSGSCAPVYHTLRVQPCVALSLGRHRDFNTHGGSTALCWLSVPFCWSIGRFVCTHLLCFCWGDQVCCCSTWPGYGCERNVSFVVVDLAVVAFTYSMHRSRRSY
jgi:hypothetical protein